MGVGVKGDDYTAVAQPFADDLGVDALGQHKAGVGMAQVTGAVSL